MTFEEEAIDLLAELFGEDADIVIEDTGAQVDLPEFAGVLASLTPAEPVPPKRGSDEYMDVVRQVARLEVATQAVNALHIFWDDFGWRGPLDLMTEWVIQIEHHPNTADESRDMFGVVDLGTIVMLKPNEEHLLRIASRQSRDPEIAEGLAAHEAFSYALSLTERAVNVGAAWKPAFRAAFAAAHEPDLTAKDRRRAVFAALFRGPGRTDKRELLQAALMLATAAMGVRNREQLTENFLKSRQDSVYDTGQINPSWSAHYSRGS
ncbi:hypothetical protein AB0M39_38050 [Streptomyces sp. NPDC051907]|uniref:hypothetical protein n=1 Tax=Streptomyces sp. NPDC051907 TaxID=3155284 RepID=UPI0034491FBB